jgi:hypothetical protein
MNSSPCASRGALFACLLLALACYQRSAHAGPVYIYLLIDPPTTAGAGVPASNGLRVTSTRSGAGTFQLYAIDDVTGSFGIKTYSIQLNGTITSLVNRSPNAIWNDLDELGPYPEGFSDLRSAVASTGTVMATQGLVNSVYIEGFGISPGDFIAANPQAAPGSTFVTSSGQWGNYSSAFSYYTNVITSSGHHRNAVFLAEGNYSGPPPTVNLSTPVNQGGTFVAYFTQHGSGASAPAPSYSSDVPFPIDPEPASVTLVGLAVFGLIGFVRRRS